VLRIVRIEGEVQEAVERLAVVPLNRRGIDPLRRDLDVEVLLVEVEAVGHVHADVAHHAP